MTEPLTGGCLCGGVRFTLAAPPVLASYCHCTRCQRRTGTASSVNARVGAEGCDISGAEHVRWWRHPDGGFEKGFCEVCGAHLFSRNPDDHAQLNVRFGVFDADPGIRPSFRQFVAYAAPWEPIPDDGLPRHDERPA